MVSRWKLDEIVETTTTPDAWGSNTGTLGDGVTTSTYPTLKTEAECVTGKCMSFDGNDYIDFGNGNELNILNNITISFWVNPSNYNFTGGAAHIFGNGTSSSIGYNIWLYGSGYIQYRTNQLDQQQVTNSYTDFIPLNKWTNIIITRNGTSANTYIDGIDRTNSHGVHIDPTTSTKNIFCGCYTTTTNYYFLNGLLDDVRIYDTTLTTAQIKQEYILGLNSLLANNNISKEEYQEKIESLGLK